MDPRDIQALNEADDILREASSTLAAEITKAHAEMTLLSAVARKTTILAGFMYKASQQGDDYLTGLMVAIGLVARNWGHLIADMTDIDFAEYMDPETEADCDDPYAHELVRNILIIKNVEQADAIRQSMKERMLEYGPAEFASTCIHTIGMYAELIRNILDIRNGDFPGAEDDH